jgi:hypothetical protein
MEYYESILNNTACDNVISLAEALNPDNLLPADQANDALELLRWHYCDLLLRHNALLKRHDELESAAMRTLEVLAMQEKRHAPVINI